MKAMTAVEVLQALGCGDDPVYYKNEETTVTGLEHQLNVHTNGHEFDALAGRVHVRFWTSRHWHSASLLRMVEMRFREAVRGKI